MSFPQVETENAVHALKDAFLGDLFWRYMLGTDVGLDHLL